VYKNGEELPWNEKYTEKVKCLNDIKFEWSNIILKNNKYVVPEDQFAILKPILIKREDETTTS
jgi:hypothetical protein